MKNYIWLIGENLGKTINNNSFYFWQHVVSKKDNIDKYLVVEKNERNRKFYATLDNDVKKYIIWRDSYKHFKLYFEADMFFVTLSYRDVRPEKLFNKKYNFATETPVIYLQHGTTGLKALGYKGTDYNNNMFRFIYYNPKIKESLIKINGFKDYQLYFGEYHPRYKELIARNDIAQNNKRQILWFITWREYIGNNVPTKKFLLNIQHVLSDKRLNDYLEFNNLTLRVCFHSQMDISKIKDIFYGVKSKNINWVHASDIDVMDELISSKLLITDYSSVGYDFTLLKKPVIQYIPDLNEYKNEREFYCDVDELKNTAVFSPSTLIDCIVAENYKLNPFFLSRITKNIDYDYIKEGKHIDRLYNYFSDIQRHKITFLGYNFYGIGGTVLATRALAEGLLENGYLVQLLSLKKNVKASNVPNALNMRPIYDESRRSKSYLLKRIFINNKKHFSYLKYDKDMSRLIPYAGYGLKKWLFKSNSETVVSTRESLHPFLYNSLSINIKNKVYYFHCTPTLFDEIFPGLIKQLKKFLCEKAIFVTEQNRLMFLEKYKYEPYKEYTILGNSIDSSRMISRDQIRKVDKKEVYTGIYLLRISKERRNDIENLLDYGRYLRDNKIDNIIINVFGTGDYLDEFLEKLVCEELTDYINYCGQTSNPKNEFEKSDVVVDFSYNHSFGMPYIEGILNGKMVFCMKNPGSLEVFEQIPEVFIESFDDLTKKINMLPERTEEELVRYYDIISNKYSRTTIAKKFISYINS